MNYSQNIKSAFINKSTFSRNDLKHEILRINPSLKESSIGWIIYKLCQQNIIQRTSRNAFKIYDSDNKDDNLSNSYDEDLSDDATEILEFLKDRFPLLTYIVWETRAFNEFSNHQTLRNFIFVEAEKPLDISVFNAIHDYTKHTVLYKPTAKEIDLYSSPVTISVMSLTSEAPISNKKTTIEKLLVDLYANRLLSRIISKGEYLEIYEEAFSRYCINREAMIRYAKRRSKDAIVENILYNIIRNANAHAIDCNYNYESRKDMQHD